MNIKTLLLGPLGTNCYIVSDTDMRKCIVIDPADNAAAILRETSDRGMNIEKIILTHTHFDHFGALNELCAATRAEVCVGRYDRAGLIQPTLNLSGHMMTGELLTFDGNVTELGEGDIVSFSDISFCVMETPGHTPGGICLVDEVSKTIFTGDTVFAGSIGRTDFPGGDFSAILRSLGRVLSYDDEYMLYPGHGALTSVANERVCNPYLSH